MTWIGWGAFFENANLKTITVAKGNKNYQVINGVLFSRDKKTLVYRPEGLKGKTYKIPSYVTTIGSYAFENNNLTSVTIPASVTEIIDYAFGYNYNEKTKENTKIDGFTIKGKSGSAAETYAKDNGFKFIAA